MNSNEVGVKPTKWDWLKNKLKAAYNWVKSKLGFKANDSESGKIPDVTVPVVLAVNAGMFMVGHIMAMAAIAGIAAVISFLFVLMAMPVDIQKKTMLFLSKYGFWVDAFLTCVLTVFGFQISVTMGLTALLIGLNLSAFFSVCRFVQKLRNNRK